MPQIKVYLNPMAYNMITDDRFSDLAESLTAAVETAFCIAGKNDVAVDIMRLLYTKNEALVQIEVVYTAGEKEYGEWIFDPDETVKKEAVGMLLNSFKFFLERNNIGQIIPSVWILPQYKSLFQAGVADDAS